MQSIIGLIDGKMVLDEYSGAMCFPKRFLRVNSTYNLNEPLKSLTENILEQTFFLGLFTHLFFWNLPSRDTATVDIEKLTRTWLQDSLIASLLLKGYDKEMGGVPEFVYSHHYEHKVEPILKANLKLGLWTRSKVRSYLHNLYYAGIALGMKYDLAIAQTIKMENLKIGFQGKPMNELVKQQIEQFHDTKTLRKAACDIITMLPKEAQDVATYFIDRWYEHLYEDSLWDKDTSIVFSDIIEDAREVLASKGLLADDETLFNMFRIVVMNYACGEVEQRYMHEIMGN